MQYTITIDDKYVPYLVKAADGVKIEDFIAMQAINVASMQISKDYDGTLKTNVNDKISAIEGN